MSKSNHGFGKFVLFCAAALCSAAGVYYYFNKKNSEFDDELEDDDFDDFDDFDTDEESSVRARRGYVNLDRKSDEEKSADFHDSSNVAGESAKTEEFFNDEKKED